MMGYGSTSLQGAVARKTGLLPKGAPFFASADSVKDDRVLLLEVHLEAKGPFFAVVDLLVDGAIAIVVQTVVVVLLID